MLRFNSKMIVLYLKGAIMQQCGQRFLYANDPANGTTANGSAPSEDDTTLGPLPEGWERRVDPNGRSYFVNHKNKVCLNIDKIDLLI